MPISVDFKGFRLEADDGGGWKIGKIAVRIRHGTATEVLRNLTYYGRLHQALDALIERVAHETEEEVGTVEELGQFLNSLRNDLIRAAMDPEWSEQVRIPEGMKDE